MKYKDWHIAYEYNITGMDFYFYHDDFDGAPDAYDYRSGLASSVEDAIEQIEEFYNDY